MCNITIYLHCMCTEVPIISRNNNLIMKKSDLIITSLFLEDYFFGSIQLHNGRNVLSIQNTFASCPFPLLFRKLYWASRNLYARKASASFRDSSSFTCLYSDGVPWPWAKTFPVPLEIIWKMNEINVFFDLQNEMNGNIREE